MDPELGTSYGGQQNLSISPGLFIAGLWFEREPHFSFSEGIYFGVSLYLNHTISKGRYQTDICRWEPGTQRESLERRYIFENS